MWSLKYEYRHKDCKYLPKCTSLNVRLLTYPINNYIKDGYIYITAIHIIEGDKPNIAKYIQHLKRISVKVDKISDNMLFTLASKETNKAYYTTLYQPLYFFPKPIVHDKNIESGEIFSWERENLTKLLKVMSKGRDTEFFRLLHLKNTKIRDVFLMSKVDHITEKQRRVFEFAHGNGYYSFPRKISLDKIAKNFRISKSTCHEILRRAETNILQEKFIEIK